MGERAVLEIETPAGQVRVEPSPHEPEHPGILVSFGGRGVALIEFCGDHGTVAVHVYHPRQGEPIVSAHLYEDAPAVEVLLEKHLCADGVKEGWTSAGLEYEFGRRLAEVSGV